MNSLPFVIIVGSVALYAIAELTIVILKAQRGISK